MRVLSLRVTRPVAVSSEQTSDWVKCESGEVCCHQHVGSKSGSARARGSMRYCGAPSRMTSRSPSAASAMRKVPPGSGWSVRTSRAEPASPLRDHLVQQCLLVEDDALAQVDAEVLERHREQMAQLEVSQCLGVGPLGAGRADARQVGGQLLVLHPSSACATY
jgi:hypothetical protein